MSATIASLPAAGVRAWKPLMRALVGALAAQRGQRIARSAQSDVLALAPPGLSGLADRFGLRDVESATLALCAAAEWDPAVAKECAECHGDPSRGWPSHALAIALFADGDWTALAPDTRMRRWRLVDVTPGASIGDARLTVDERVLNHLAGRSFLDVRLDGLIRPCPATSHTPDDASRSIVARWNAAHSVVDCPLVDLGDVPVDEARRVAAAVCSELGVHLLLLDSRDLPSSCGEREALARLWEREALLVNGALLIECGGDAARAAHFIETLQGLVIAFGTVPPTSRPYLRGLTSTNGAAGLAIWQRETRAVNPALGKRVAPIAAQFRLSRDGVRQVVGQVATRAGEPLDALVDALWEACRVQVRGSLDALAQRIDAHVAWDDLVLPDAQMTALRTMALHVRQRHRVHSDWGFDAKGQRGLGIAALFSGPSGTGKTLAAEVIANELRLDLYRIDLAAVTSKYIGETQKNLKQVFDIADAGGAILLFDEADALFGARGEVRDSLDRHANSEVAYLLQRMDTYRGLAILTSNMKQSLDSAFVRRIRFVVNFPFPDAAARAQIWRRAFPPQTPRKGLHVDRLARLALSGGSIRNLAIGAAFLAADEGQPVRMKHLLQAADAEYAKLDKPLPRAETGDWT